MRFIYDQEIFDFAAEMCGGEISETVMRALCRAAAGELRQRLREGVGAEEIRELFVAAAGVLALSMYTAAGGRSTVTSFKAGNLSVTCADGGEPVSATGLRRMAENMLAAYLRDEGFGFLGVRG